MFELIFNQGETLEDSFFVAKGEGKELKINCSEIMPDSVREKIQLAAAEGKIPEDIKTPEEIAEVLKAESNGSIDKLAELVAELKMEASAENNKKIASEDKKESKLTPEAQEFISKEIEHLIKDKGYDPERAKGAAYNIAREKGFDIPPAQASLKVSSASDRDPLFSWDSKETPKVPTKTDELTMAVNPKEFDSDTSGLGKGKSSKIKSFYGRLPAVSQVGAPPTMAINLQSKILAEKYNLVKKALMEEREKNAELKKKLDESVEKVDTVEKTRVISVIISTLKQVCPVSKDIEERIKKILTTLDKKSLTAINEVVDILSQRKEEKEPAKEMLKEDIPVAKEEKEPKKASVTVPQVYLSEHVVGLDRLSQIFE